jgi:hypothetical protein
MCCKASGDLCESEGSLLRAVAALTHIEAQGRAIGVVWCRPAGRTIFSFLVRATPRSTVGGDETCNAGLPIQKGAFISLRVRWRLDTCAFAPFPLSLLLIDVCGADELLGR